VSDLSRNPHLLDRHHLRLPGGAYRQTDVVFSVTIAVLGRRPAFSDSELAAATVAEMLRQAELTGVGLYAFCLMPDHFHIVVSPSPACDVVSFVARLKSLTTRVAWRHGVQGILWQRSFWDHSLRRDEQLGNVVEYVLRNPVRKGLVSEWQEYPFCGVAESGLR
jgi:putative transposase